MTCHATTTPINEGCRVIDIVVIGSVITERRDARTGYRWRHITASYVGHIAAGYHVLAIPHCYCWLLRYVQHCVSRLRHHWLMSAIAGRINGRVNTSLLMNTVIC